jgi:hypothetical protein
MRPTFASTVVLSFLLAGCGGGSGPAATADAGPGSGPGLASDGGGSGADPGAAGISLAATPPLAVHLASENPGAGNAFLSMSVTLTNRTLSASLPTSPVSFSLELSDHLVVYAWIHGVSAVANACDGNLAVAEGGSASCALVFAVPTGATPAALHYADGFGDTASALIASVPSGPSGTLVCNTSTCDAATQDCCVPGADAGASCVPRGTCTGGTVSCESAANCGAGMVCCLAPAAPGGASGVRVSCEANECAGGYQVCATSTECVSGSCHIASGSPAGICGP